MDSELWTWFLGLVIAAGVLTVACGQDPAPSPIIIVATPTLSVSSSSPQTEDQTAGSATGYEAVQCSAS